MDEFDTTLQTDASPAEETPREVVLCYQQQGAQPVTLRYFHPDPLPGRREQPEPQREEPREEPHRLVYDPPAQPAVKQRSHKGRRIFLSGLAILLVISLVVSVIPRAKTEKKQPDKGGEAEKSFRFELRPSGFERSNDAETTIPRHANGDGTRLRPSETHGAELTIQEVYERVNPCTVTVVTALPDGSAYVGTGVIFTENGYVLTNAHLVVGGERCYVVLADGNSFSDARLVGYDVDQDLAVIKVNARGLPVAEFGDSDTLTVGDTVYAIGNPLGVELRGTLTDGIVSAINRDVTVDGVRMTLIQTNAALNNGNSGGPLINVYGQVVGVNTMKMGSSSTVSVEGLGFAIPISSSAWMVDDLIEYGELRGEPVLGIIVEAVTLPSGEHAMLVHEVTADSGAERAGIRSGDHILRADGETLETTGDLLRIRRRLRAGDTLTLEIERDGERFPVDLVLQASLD